MQQSDISYKAQKLCNVLLSWVVRTRRGDPVTKRDFEIIVLIIKTMLSSFLYTQCLTCSRHSEMFVECIH